MHDENVKASAAPAEGCNPTSYVEWANQFCAVKGRVPTPRDAWDAATAFATAPTMSEADAKDAARYRCLRSQMQVGAVRTQLPLYRVLHWHGFEDCNDIRHADEAIDAEIERAAAKGESDEH